VRSHGKTKTLACQVKRRHRKKPQDSGNIKNSTSKKVLLASHTAAAGTVAVEAACRTVVVRPKKKMHSLICMCTAVAQATHNYRVLWTPMTKTQLLVPFAVVASKK
jgi:hypothetical protein